MDKISNEKELKRVEARIDTIRKRYDSNQTTSQPDRDELKKLKDRKEELKGKLGWIV